MAPAEKSICAVCGTAAPAPFRPPVPAGAPDLDLRPAEPARGSLSQWVQTCRACYAAAPDLATLPLSAAEIVRSENYRWLERHAPHVRPFLRWARLCPAHLRSEVFLMAAWSEDDAGNADAARVLRQRALRVWGQQDGLPAALRRLDMLRRTEAWAAAAEAAAWLDRQALDSVGAAILRLQHAKIAARDSARHSLAGAAAQPPVAPERVGWVRRLLRR